MIPTVVVVSVISLIVDMYIYIYTYAPVRRQPTRQANSRQPCKGSRHAENVIFIWLYTFGGVITKLVCSGWSSGAQQHIRELKRSHKVMPQAISNGLHGKKEDCKVHHSSHSTGKREDDGSNLRMCHHCFLVVFIWVTRGERKRTNHHSLSYFSTKTMMPAKKVAARGTVTNVVQVICDMHTTQVGSVLEAWGGV